MTKDLFEAVGYKYIGPGGLRCICCDQKLCHKRKSKINRNLLNTMKRSILKKMILIEIREL